MVNSCNDGFERKVKLFCQLGKVVASNFIKVFINNFGFKSGSEP